MYEDGQHIMYMWVPVKESEVREKPRNILKGNRFAVLVAEGEQVFNRQV